MDVMILLEKEVIVVVLLQSGTNYQWSVKVYSLTLLHKNLLQKW